MTKTISLFLACCFLLFHCSYSQNPPLIIPAPASLEMTRVQFILSANTIIQNDPATELSAKYLSHHLSEHYGITLQTRSTKESNTTKNKSVIRLITDKNEHSKSRYRLDVAETMITIKGSASGIFSGIQTLIQLLPDHSWGSIVIPGIRVADSARFSYRGVHLDVSRHFFPVDAVKRYIDYLALHKMNIFHWHLTDDQGWRIEIKKYPLLTATGSCREQTLVGPYGTNKYDGKKHCGYYTQQDIREVVRYAAERYITIIPEIEMPGHSMAALASYPYLGCTKGPYQVMQTWGVSDDVLCAGNDSTFSFLEDVLDEVMALFPSAYIHIGGDECPKERWHDCISCQKRIKDNNLKDEHGLQSYFISRIEKYINSKGRNIIGWDEILEGGLAPNATVMSWRGEEGGIEAARQHHHAIMTPGTPLYFNSSQSINEDSITQGGYCSLKMVYEYDPIPKQLSASESGYILGAQANMWTEYMDNEAKVQYMLFPRIAALSEALWTDPAKKSWQRFEQGLPALFSRYDFWGINYSKAYFDIQTSVSYTSNQHASDGESDYTWSLTAFDKKSKIRIRLPDDAEITSSSNKLDVTPSQTGDYVAYLFDSTGKTLGSPVRQYFHINKATGRRISLSADPDKNYAVGGPLTLADGIQNSKGMSKSSQFLGFWGTDCEATIDLGEIQKVDSVTFHAFVQNASWIYPPKQVVFWESTDGKNFNLLSQNDTYEGQSNIIYRCLKPTQARYIRINAENYGQIPSGKPGAGNKAWLFSDEIEIF